jgi:hypothetical protein
MLALRLQEWRHETLLTGGCMIRYLIGIAAAAVLAATTAAWAQDPAENPPRTSTTPSAQQQVASVTVEGCLRREQDVQGREPNVAERAAAPTGLLQDYILTDTKIVKGSAPAAASSAAPSSGAAPAGSTPSAGATTAGGSAPSGSTAGATPSTGATAAREQDRPTGTAGSTAAMYEVDGLSDELMKQHVGRRVQIDGNFEKLGTDKVEANDLLDLEATAIRPVSGECRP